MLVTSVSLSKAHLPLFDEWYSPPVLNELSLSVQ